MPDVLPAHPRRSPRAIRAAFLIGLAVVVAAGATGATLLVGATTPVSVAKTPAPQLTPAPPVTFVVPDSRGTVVPWNRPLRFVVQHATILSLSAIGPDGLEMAGTLSPQSWVSASTLIPGQPYRISATVQDANGVNRTIDKQVVSSPPAEVLKATITPKGGTYGVGQPVIVRLDHKVVGAAARLALMRRLQVTTTPAVAGAWRWYNSYELHYRGPTYWRAGTKISVTATLAGLRLPGTDIWGSTTPVSSSFQIGRSMISTVDLATKMMTVRQDGKVIKVMKISGGKPKYPSKGGPHIVLTRERVHLFNSATVGIPTASPEGYYLKLPWAVRISNGGTFVHSQPATIRHQGRRNVSHGCINASPTDAKWFYENSKLGDVVDVINYVAPPVRSDAGMFDWNYSWDKWRTGNLDG